MIGVKREKLKLPTFQTFLSISATRHDLANGNLAVTQSQRSMSRFVLILALLSLLRACSAPPPLSLLPAVFLSPFLTFVKPKSR